MTDFPSFAAFYQAVHGRDPFPWQQRLADLVTTQGWPSDIGVATGLGKTSCIDIAVWSLAAQGTLPAQQRTLPRRIWYVVDRRLLVDAASSHAQRLSDLLADPPAGPIAAVATGLRAMCATDTDRPLHVWRLRGGATPGDHPGGRPPDPAQPAVICSTVAMYGSRLLFRGFGSSRSLSPIDAAHAGTDSLVLLDEAHLARPLQQLVALLPVCDANRTGVLRWTGHHQPTDGPAALLPHTRAYPQLVNLTATGAAAAFDLDASDRAHPVVARRLDAAKPTRLVATTEAALPAALAEQLREELAHRPPTIAAIVFVNSPATARGVATLLGADPGSGPIDLVVLTGQLRDPDAERVRRRLLDPATGAAAGTTPTRAIPLVVVATQTLEVGADLDFDVCISQTAGVRALVQRWGRLNRLGERSSAAGVLVHPDDSGGGLYGDEPAQIWRRLNAVEPLDLGPAHIRDLLGDPADTPGRVGELLPWHLWEFAKTSELPAGAAPPEVFFDTLDDNDRRIGVLWRAVLPDPGQPLVPAPADAETIEVPIHELRAILDENPEAGTITGDGVTTETTDRDQLRPGQRIVLPATAGRGYGASGWDPSVTGPVLDLSPQLRATLHLSESAMVNFLGTPLDAPMRDLLLDLEFDPDDGPNADTDQTTAASIRSTLLAEDAGERGLLGATRFRVERIGDDQAPILLWDPPGPAPPARVDALDELSNAPRVGLHDHCASVGELAERIATAIGLPTALTDAAAQAGQFHDLGKADHRFQRWLGNTDGPPIAKSAMPQAAWRRAATAAGWPIGGRHELLSVQLIAAHLDNGHTLPNPDLIRHLVMTHHGHGRPLCPTTTHGAAITTHTTIDGFPVATHTDTRAADWDQPDRFRALCEQYGYWGLALLEAVLRQADHRVSAATQIEVI